MRGCMRDVIPAPVPGLDLRREYGHHQSPAIRAGGIVFCSGMVALDPHSGRTPARYGNERGAAYLREFETAAGIDGVVTRPSGAGARDDLRPHRVRRAQPPLPTVCPECAAGPHRDERADRGRLQGHARRHRRGGNASAGGDDISPTADRNLADGGGPACRFRRRYGRASSSFCPV